MFFVFLFKKIRFQAPGLHGEQTKTQPNTVQYFGEEFKNTCILKDFGLMHPMSLVVGNRLLT